MALNSLSFISSRSSMGLLPSGFGLFVSALLIYMTINKLNAGFKLIWL